MPWKFRWILYSNPLLYYSIHPISDIILNIKFRLWIFRISDTLFQINIMNIHINITQFIKFQQRCMQTVWRTLQNTKIKQYWPYLYQVDHVGRVMKRTRSAKTRVNNQNNLKLMIETNVEHNWVFPAQTWQQDFKTNVEHNWVFPAQTWQQKFKAVGLACLDYSS